MVEHLTFNQRVEGSSPSWLTILLLQYLWYNNSYHAVMAELADALDSGSSGGNTVEVQVLLTAPLFCGRSSIGRASPCQGEGRGFETRRPLHSCFVPLAQLDRAFDYESKGREFESLRARHYLEVRN